jgi:hypothetical protein
MKEVGRNCFFRWKILPWTDPLRGRRVREEIRKLIQAEHALLKGDRALSKHWGEV